MTFFIDMRTIPSFTLPPITVTAQEVLGVFCLDFAHTLRTPVETGEKGGGGENPQKRALEEAVRCHQPEGLLSLQNTCKWLF